MSGAKFDSVCMELQHALKREKVAERLLKEQSSRLTELSLQLYTSPEGEGHGCKEERRRDLSQQLYMTSEGGEGNGCKEEQMREAGEQRLQCDQLTQNLSRVEASNTFVQDQFSSATYVISLQLH